MGDPESGVELFAERTGRVLTWLQKLFKWIKGNLLLILTVLGIILGIGLGFLVRQSKPSADVIMYVSFPGDLLLRMLKCLIVPLVVSSVITGVSAVDVKTSGQIAGRTLLYFLCTSCFAIVTGIVAVVTVQPGYGNEIDVRMLNTTQRLPSTTDTFLDLVRNVFPENLVQAGFQRMRTTYIRAHTPSQYNDREGNFSVNITDDSDSSPETDTWIRKFEYSDGNNILGLMMFSTLFGIAISKLGTRARILADFFNALNEVIMELLKIILWYSPIGLLFLIAGSILSIEDPEKVGLQLGMYTLTVLLGSVFHTLLTLPLIYFLVTRRNPYKMFSSIREALVTAFGTCSSAATLPISIQCMEKNAQTDKRVVNFVLPLGCTINMDGTALYEAVACIFIAQRNNITLGLGKLLAISFSAMSVSVGASAIPGFGLVSIILALTIAGLPLEDVSFLLTIDWFLERVRTTMNVCGDCFGAAVIGHTLRHEMDESNAYPGEAETSAV